MHADAPDYVIGHLKNIIEHSTTLNGEDRLMNAAAANRALELLGRHLGMFTYKVEHEVYQYDDLIRKLGGTD
jgi:hypothetical protein